MKVNSVFNALKRFHVCQLGVLPYIWGYFILQSCSVLEVFHWFKKGRPRSSSMIWCSHKTTWCQSRSDQTFRSSYLKLESPTAAASIDWWQSAKSRWWCAAVNTPAHTYGWFGLHFGSLWHYSGPNLKFGPQIRYLCIMHFESKPSNFKRCARHPKKKKL